MSIQNSSSLGELFIELFVSFSMTSLVGQHIRQSSLIACNSDYGILAALQTVGTGVRTQRHRLDAVKFPMFSVGWT